MTNINLDAKIEKAKRLAELIKQNDTPYVCTVGDMKATSYFSDSYKNVTFDDAMITYAKKIRNNQV